MDLGAVIARNVRAERARRLWTQEYVASQLGWSPPSISELERGRRRVTAADLPALCGVFGISLVQLCFGADPEDLARLRIIEKP